MSLGQDPSPTTCVVKPILFVLWSDEAILEKALRAAESVWGPIDVLGRAVAFDRTDYYEEEMGPGLQRRIVSFENSQPAEFLVDARLNAGRIEDEFRRESRRQVNLDLGYLDLHKIVLSSMKGAGQKIYLGKGVYADLVARFRKGRYQPFEWTFPDIRAGAYDEDLLTIRQIHREQARRGTRGT